MNLRIDLNEPRILAKVTSDEFGLEAAKEVKTQYDPFTPKETGALMGAIGALVETRPWQNWHKADYAENVYYNNRGVTFITSGSGMNPYATDHWDLKMAQAGKLSNVYRSLNNWLHR